MCYIHKVRFAELRITHNKVMDLIGFVREIEYVRGRDPIKVFTKGNCGLLCKIMRDRFGRNALSYVGFFESLSDGHYFTRIHNFIDCKQEELDNARHLAKPFDDSDLELSEKREYYMSENSEKKELRNRRVLLPNEELLDFYDITGRYNIPENSEHWWSAKSREFDNCCNFEKDKVCEMASMQRSRQLCKMFAESQKGLRDLVDVERELYNLNERY